MKKQMPYSTPEGYFEDLKQRLGDIPQRAQKVSTWQKVSPYLALAAVFAAAFIVGSTMLRKTAPTASEEDIVEYLLDSDMTLAQLEDVYFFSEE